MSYVEDSPLISVLMAEYNTPADRLEASLRSVLRQTERRFELLLVNDGSSTDVREIVERLGDARIRVVEYGENRGFVDALNFGLKHARGRFIARMDTDDEAEPFYLETVLRQFDEHPEYTVVSGQAREFSSDGPALIQGRAGELTPSLVMRGFTPVHPATMMRADAVRGVGGYPKYRRAEDLALWCELLLAGHRLCVVPVVAIHYRVDAEDFSKRKLRNRRDEIRVRLRYYPRLGAGPREYLTILKSIVSGLLPVSILRRVRARTHARA